MLLDELFDRPRTRDRHGNAPLRNERESFLAHMRTEGTSIRNVQIASSVLLHIVRILQLDVLRVVSTETVKDAVNTWVGSTELEGGHRRTENSKNVFRAIILRFLRFHGALIQADASPSFAGQMLDEFLSAMKEKGLAATTISTQASELRSFLRWLSDRADTVASTSVTDIDDYFHYRRLSRSLSSIATEASALRSFFVYLEDKGQCDPYISSSIKVGTVPRKTAPSAPSWSEVRRMLALSVKDTNDSRRGVHERRMQAMLLFCSVYGFRTSEVCRLRLADFAWRQGAFTVTRSKNGRVQRFPIIEELQAKLENYLAVRPRCASELLFVTIRPPFRQVKPGLLSMETNKRFGILGIYPPRQGAHALRHACASELLRAGASLPQLADFLGHRGVSTVSRYAKHDAKSLEVVANFSLGDVL